MSAPTLYAIPMALVSSLLLAACADLSGLGGKSQYACAAPQGVQCNSVSGNYYNSFQPRSSGSGNATKLPINSALPASTSGAETLLHHPSAAHAARPSPLFEAAALRSPPRIVRLWIKPWEDSEHDLVDQSYVYVQTDPGRWQIAHAQRQIRDAYAPLKPPAPLAATPAAQAPPVAVPQLPAPADDNRPSGTLSDTQVPDIPPAGGDASDTQAAPPL